MFQHADLMNILVGRLKDLMGLWPAEKLHMNHFWVFEWHFRCQAKIFER